MTPPKSIPNRNEILIGYENEENGAPVSLPLMFSTDSTAIIGRKGSGKSTLARKVAEGLIQHQLHPVIIDPLDVWWGLRAAADGKGPGLDVIIFGGSHADLPITEHSASYIADLVVNKHVSAVLVLDEMKQAPQRRFVQRFMERLFELKRPQEMRTPLHVIIDEADTFIPQNPMTPEAIGSLSEVDRAIRHGRSRGIGTTVISQRPAKVNKDVLTQCEVLIAMQVTGPQDRKALREWTDAKATEDQAKRFWESLASMKRGQAWVWSPALLDCFTMVNVELPWTYDSSFTPSINAKKPPTAKLKDLDLSSIKEAMAVQIEEAKANDPKALKAEVARLKAELAKKVPPAPSSMTQKQVDDVTKAALAERDKSWQTTLQASLKARDEHWLHRLAKLITFETAQLTGILTTGAEKIAKDLSGTKLKPQISEQPQKNLGSFHMGPGSNSRPPPDSVTKRIVDSLTDGINKRAAAATGTGDGSLTGPERKILIALAQHDDHHPGEPLERNRTAIRAGYSPDGGAFGNPLGSARARGLIENSGSGIRITASGKAALGAYPRMPEGPELFTWWCYRLSGPERKILEALKAAGEPMERSALAAASGYSPDGGAFGNPLGSLRSRGLIEGKNGQPIKLHEDIA